jgi:hypothetical protein
MKPDELIETCKRDQVVEIPPALMYNGFGNSSILSRRRRRKCLLRPATAQVSGYWPARLVLAQGKDRSAMKTSVEWGE